MQNKKELSVSFYPSQHTSIDLIREKKKDVSLLSFSFLAVVELHMLKWSRPYI